MGAGVFSSVMTGANEAVAPAILAPHDSQLLASGLTVAPQAGHSAMAITPSLHVCLVGETNVRGLERRSDLGLEGVDDLRILEDILALGIGEPIPNVGVFHNLHETTTVAHLTDNVLDDAFFNRIAREILEELLQTLIDAASHASSFVSNRSAFADLEGP